MAALSVDLTDVHVDVVAELGRRQITLGEARRLRPGDVVELDQVCGAPYALLVNGRVFGSGETVVVHDRLQLLLTRLLDGEGSP